VAAPTRTVIRPGRGALGVRAAEFWSYRELLYFLVWRDAKVRYRQTVLGVLWAVIQPVATMGVFSLFFGRLAAMPSDGVSYPLFALTGLVPWTYFSTAFSSTSNALVGSQQLISKVYFPRLIIPLAAVVTPLIDLAIALLMLVAVWLWVGGPAGTPLLAAPLFLILAVGTALAAGLWSSALNVEYRDIRYLLPFALQFWLFATPVAYPASLIPERWRPLYGLNPMATVVEGLRWSMLGTPAPGVMSLVSVMVVAAALYGGVAYFRRVEGTFADVI
jgi:lipopolysaccharide transport system permease protein